MTTPNSHRWTRWYPIRGLAVGVPAFREIRVGNVMTYPELVVNEGHWRRCLDCPEREEKFRWVHGDISEFASGSVEVGGFGYWEHKGNEE